MRPPNKKCKHNKDSGEKWPSYSPRETHSGTKTKINTACYINPSKRQLRDVSWSHPSTYPRIKDFYEDIQIINMISEDKELREKIR